MTCTELYDTLKKIVNNNAEKKGGFNIWRLR